MAFDRSNFNPGSRGGKGPKQASYYTDDQISTVEADGYFDDMSTELETGDLLYVYSAAASDGGGKLYTVTKSAGDIALSTGTAIS